MLKNIENLKIESIHKGTAKKHGEIVCRKDNSFILRTTGCMRYIFSDRFIDIHPGNIILLPKGSSYIYTAVTDTPCEYISVKFEADFSEATPSYYPFEGFHEADEFINNLTDLWKFGGQSEHYRCYSVFYNLLAYIENLEKMSYIDKKKSAIIFPAVSYLKKHIYDCDLKAEILPQLCGISGTYFRKIFQANYSVTPQKYILSKRLAHAKNIIDNGDYDTISEIAASVGYSDPLYFSRAFKKKYGISPSQYSKD